MDLVPKQIESYFSNLLNNKISEDDPKKLSQSWVKGIFLHTVLKKEEKLWYDQK